MEIYDIHRFDEPWTLDQIIKLFIIILEIAGNVKTCDLIVMSIPNVPSVASTTVYKRPNNQALKVATLLKIQI